MEIRFCKPFDDLAGTGVLRLKISGSITVRDFLKSLGAQIPSFAPYIKKEGDEVQNFFAVLVRNGEILRLDDRVQDEETIRVFPPISGG
jgi:molybdopterin converting factor small subunit